MVQYLSASAGIAANRANSLHLRYFFVSEKVIIPFLIGRISDLHAASFSFMPGVMPPIPLVRAAHRIDGTEIVFRFRVTERQTNGLPVAFKARLDQLASERVLSLACFLDTQAGLCMPSSALGSAPAYRSASSNCGHGRGHTTG